MGVLLHRCNPAIDDGLPFTREETVDGNLVTVPCGCHEFIRVSVAEWAVAAGRASWKKQRNGPADSKKPKLVEIHSELIPHHEPRFFAQLISARDIERAFGEGNKKEQERISVFGRHEQMRIYSELSTRRIADDEHA